MRNGASSPRNLRSIRPRHPHPCEAPTGQTIPATRPTDERRWLRRRRSRSIAEVSAVASPTIGPVSARPGWSAPACLDRATEIAEALFGIAPADSGSIEVEGRAVHVRRARPSWPASGYVPGDRLTQGVFLDATDPRDIDRRATSIGWSVDSNLFRWSAAEQMDRPAFADADGLVAAVDRGSLAEPLQETSSASCSPVAGAHAPRAISTAPLSVLTWVPMRTSSNCHARKSLEGLATVVISDDVPDFLAVCHRVIVIRRGRIARELRGDDLSEGRYPELAA